MEAPVHGHRVYVIGWSQLDVMKVGVGKGNYRERQFINCGARLLDYYMEDSDPFGLEAVAESVIRDYPQPFATRLEAIGICGRKGSGFLECRLIPAADWPDVLACIRREVAAHGYA